MIDRGMQKWQGFMLSEHIGMIGEQEYENKKVSKPVIDEQEFEQIGIVVMESLNYTTDIKITFWEDGFFKEVIGVVAKVDMLIKQIKVELEDDILFLFIDCITAAERI